MALKENGREHEPQKRNKFESQLRQFLKLTKVSHMITETAAVERLAFKNWINPFCIGVVLSGKTVTLCSCSVALKFSSVCFLNRCLNRRLHNFLPLSNQWSPWMWVKGRKDFFFVGWRVWRKINESLRDIEHGFHSFDNEYNKMITYNK